MTLPWRWPWGPTVPVRSDRPAARCGRCNLGWRRCSRPGPIRSWFAAGHVKYVAIYGPIGVLLVAGLKALPSEAAALQLLDALQGLEQQFGRDRSREQRWGPRSLDLDLLFWGELRLEHPRLLLPHPRLHLRTFVLAPLLEAMHGSASR